MSITDKWIRKDGRMAVLTIYDGQHEREVRVPFAFRICPHCEGCATDRGRSVECDGGGFTAEEWNEQDEDFRRDYIAGVYDKPCDYCRPNPGRVLMPDTNSMSPRDLDLWVKQIRDEQEYEALCAAERRMGA